MPRHGLATTIFTGEPLSVVAIRAGGHLPLASLPTRFQRSIEDLRRGVFSRLSKDRLASLDSLTFYGSADARAKPIVPGLSTRTKPSVGPGHMVSPPVGSLYDLAREPTLRPLTAFRRCDR